MRRYDLLLFGVVLFGFAFIQSFAIYEAETAYQKLLVGSPHGAEHGESSEPGEADGGYQEWIEAHARPDAQTYGLIIVVWIVTLSCLFGFVRSLVSARAGTSSTTPEQ